MAIDIHDAAETLLEEWHAQQEAEAAEEELEQVEEGEEDLTETPETEGEQEPSETTKD